MREQLLEAVNLLDGASNSLTAANDQPMVEEAIRAAEQALTLMRSL